MASILLSTSPSIFPAINTQQQVQQLAPIVPASKWSNDAFTDASMRHEFIAVGIPNRNRVTIQDAYDIWAADPAVLFQTGYRIAGTREVITADLKASQMTDEQIEPILATAVSSENYLGDMAPEFHKEMKEYIAWNRTAIKTNATAPGNTMFTTMSTMNPSLLAGPNKPRAPNVNPGVNAGGPGRKVESITQKLQKLSPGYYLDVSNMDDFGRKTKPITPDKLAGRVGSNRIPIVSNKLDRYIMAINMIPGGSDAYAEDVAQVTQLLAGQSNTGYYPQTGTMPQQAQQMHQPQQVPFTPPDASGFQPFTPQPNGSVIPQGVAPIMTAKQRKQKKAAMTQQPFPGFGQVQQPLYFPNMIAGTPTGARRQLDFNNVITADDDNEYYDDDEEDDGFFAPQQPQQSQQPQQQFQQPQQQFQQQPQQQFTAPRPAAFPAAQQFAPQQPQQFTAQVPRPAAFPVAQQQQFTTQAVQVPRPVGFPVAQQFTAQQPQQQFPVPQVPRPLGFPIPQQPQQRSPPILQQPQQRSPPIPLVPITTVPLVPVRSPQVQQQQGPAQQTPLM